MDKCKELDNFPAFPDGRKFCPATLPQSSDATNMKAYEVKCVCDSHPEGCVMPIGVFTDGIEAIRDVFWGKVCKTENITITAKRL